MRATIDVCGIALPRCDNEYFFVVYIKTFAAMGVNQARWAEVANG